MRSLYGKWTLTPLYVVLLTLTACGPAGQTSVMDRELSSLAPWTPAGEPGLAATEFITAWNVGERAGVLRLFADDRRRIVAAAPELDERLRAWQAIDVDVPAQCHPRGAYFKTAVVAFEDRRSGAPIQEIVWLHLKDGGWWMYSL